jgi:hypothetical protein
MVGSETDINVTYHNTVLGSVQAMTRARASQDWHAYCSYYMDALEMLMPFIPAKLRPGIEADLRAVYSEVAVIRGGQGISGEAKVKQELEVLRDFSDHHKGYLYICFERAGIIKLREEGVLDFDEIDIETVAKVVRNASSGLPNALKEAGAIKGDVDGKPA